MLPTERGDSHVAAGRPPAFVTRMGCRNARLNTEQSRDPLRSRQRQVHLEPKAPIPNPIMHFRSFTRAILIARRIFTELEHE